MWKELLTNLTKDNAFVRLNPPAAEADIRRVERALKVRLPLDLRALLMELNGDNFFIFSTDQIIETNQSLRAIKAFMPLDCMLFISGNGCGDYYGYAITGEGLKDWEIYMWEHEYDNRIYKANGLKDVIERYYTDSL